MIENNNELDFEQEMEDELANRELVGTFLRNARITNNVPIEALAKEFIISKQELIEFETGYADASNPHFVRLLARKYAKKFDVENEEFIALLDKAYPKLNDEYTQVIPEIDSVSFNTSIVKNNNKRLVKRVLIYVVSLVFLLVLLTSLVVLLTKNVQSISTDTQNETTLLSTTNLVAETVVGEKPKTDIKFVEYKTLNDGTLDTLVYDVTQVDEAAKFEATITAKEDAYITIYDENWTVMESQVYIKKGESYTYDATNFSQLNITVDNIENVEISINGADIKLADQNKEGYYLIQINNKVQ